MFTFLLLSIILLSFLCGVCFQHFKLDCYIKKISIIILIIIFSLIIAFRPDFVPDTKGYNEIFENIDINKNYGFNIFGECLTVEYGFFYVMRFFKAISNNVHFFYFFLTLFSCLLFAYAISKLLFSLEKTHINVGYLLCVYFSYYGIYYNGIAIRQGLALSLCFLSLCCFIRKKYIRLVLYFVIAFLVHRLSILFLISIVLFALFKNKGFSKRFLVAVNILCLAYYLISLFFGTSKLIYSVADYILRLIGLHSAYGGWLENFANIPPHVSLTNLFICIQGVVLISFCRTRNSTSVFCGMYLIGEIISVLFANMSAACRLYDFFTIYSVIIIACIFSGRVAKQNGLVVNRQNNELIKSTNYDVILAGLLLICNVVLVLNIIYNFHVSIL